MAAILLAVLLTVVFSHWILEPVVWLLTPLVTLSWLPWGLLLIPLWLLAGSSAQSDAPLPPPRQPRGRD